MCPLNGAKQVRQTGRKATGQAELIGKNAEKMFTAAAVTLTEEAGDSC